jgi:hypothetical protein
LQKSSHISPAPTTRANAVCVKLMVSMVQWAKRHTSASDAASGHNTIAEGLLFTQCDTPPQAQAMALRCTSRLLLQRPKPCMCCLLHRYLHVLWGVLSQHSAC